MDFKCVFCGNILSDYKSIIYVGKPDYKCVCTSCWYSLSIDDRNNLALSGALNSMLKGGNVNEGC